MASIGLGENSPIKLQLTRENFNALIGRRSQPIRWLVSEKCPCIKDNQKVDENCTFCNGNGVVYSVQTESLRVETFTAPINGVIEKTNVLWVRDFSGNSYTITSQDCVAYVTGVIRGREYQVAYTEDITLSGTGIAQYVGSQLYKIDLPVSVDFGSVQGSLLTVTASVSGTALTITNIFRNYFEISDTIASSAQVDVVYTYVNPFKFALINNNFTKQDQKFLSEKNGDGLLIFPQRWSIDSGDVAIALNSTQINKVVNRSTGAETDRLPNFYLDTLISAYSIRLNVKHKFVPNTDFVLYKNNQIKWITTNKPTAGEQVSYTYSYNTVYKVLQDVPDPRTSEDNRFPRKVALKSESGYSSREEF